MRLSVVIPCYNEERTIATLLGRVADLRVAGASPQVIVVDDGSGDRTAAIAEDAARGREGWTVLRLPKNAGKGSAIAAALPLVAGDAVLVQDADLEYDPKDVGALAAAWRDDGRVAVYGSRSLGRNRFSSPLFYAGGRAVTAVANALYGTRLTDMPTGYKLVAAEHLRAMDLASRRFEFCAEVTAKLARLGVEVVEVPISYAPRSVAEGKKIRARDGVVAVGTLARHRFWKPPRSWNALDRFIRRLRTDAALAAVPDGARVLDLGCGVDRYLWSRLRGRVAAYAGVDSRIARAARDGAASFQPFDAEKNGRLPFDDGAFDAIVALAVIEHVADPVAFLDESRRVLSLGGVLVLTTPTPAAKPVLEALAAVGAIDAEEIREHKTYFTEDALLAACGAAGFRDARVSTFELGFNRLLVARS
jgi:dolichol-phosphate mannosyltransferase